MLLRPASLVGRLCARAAVRVGLASGGRGGGVWALPPRIPLLAAAAATTTPSADGTPQQQQPDVLTATARAVPGPSADALADALLAYGALSAAVEEDRAGAGGAETPLFGPDRSGGRVWPACTVTAIFPLGTDVEDATGAAAAAAGIGPGALAWSVAAEAAAAWQAALHGDFQAARVNAGPPGVPLWIVPAWCEVPPEAKHDVCVRLTPGLAFGTGDHPTTRACLRWLAGGLCDGGGAAPSPSPLPGLVGGSVLDFGAGSGVLAVAALALGAKSAVATDVDGLAVRATAENAELNGVGERVASLLVDGDGGPGDAAAVGLPAGDAYAVVVANILQGPLLALAPVLAAAAAPGGQVAVAGILRSQAPPVVAALEKGGVTQSVRVLDVGEGDDGWVLVTGRKKEAL